MWHHRLGHPGPRALEHLVNSSEGVRIKGIPTYECDACATSKLKKQIRRAPRHEGRVLALGERLAVDFHDFETDARGYSTVVLVSDRASGYIWDYYLQGHHFDPIKNCLEHLIKLVKHQYNLTTKVIECDNEIRGTLEDALTDYHLLFVEHSPPNTQDLNGAAERSGGVIKFKARSMRGKLPTDLWQEIHRAAVYLFNRTPRYANKWKSPYETFFNRRPKQEHLRAYGCKAFALTKEA